MEWTLMTGTAERQRWTDIHLDPQFRQSCVALAVLVENFADTDAVEDPRTHQCDRTGRTIEFVHSAHPQMFGKRLHADQPLRTIGLAGCKLVWGSLDRSAGALIYGKRRRDWPQKLGRYLTVGEGLCRHSARAGTPGSSDCLA